MLGLGEPGVLIFCNEVLLDLVSEFFVLRFVPVGDKVFPFPPYFDGGAFDWLRGRGRRWGRRGRSRDGLRWLGSCVLGRGWGSLGGGRLCWGSTFAGHMSRTDSTVEGLDISMTPQE